MSEVSLDHIDTCGTHRVCLHATLTGGHLGSFTHDTPACCGMPVWCLPGLGVGCVGTQGDRSQSGAHAVAWGTEASWRRYRCTAWCGMPVWCLPGWGVVCEATYVPPTQSGMQAHPVRGASVSMTQAEPRHQTR